MHIVSSSFGAATLLALALACGDPARAELIANSAVFIEAGLKPELPLSRIAPTPPAPFGGGHVVGTIQSIERVALVRGQNVPSVYPGLSPQPTDVPVWVVVCRGQFHFSGLGTSAGGTRAFYFVHHKSGALLSWGMLGTDAP